MDSVVITTGDNNNFIFFNLVNKTMFTVNPAGPAPGELKTEGFWFSCSIKGGSPDFFKKRQNSVGLAFISLQPIAQVVESSRRKSDIHSPRASMGVRLPDRASSRHCISREALAGLESRYSLSIMDS